MQEVILYSRANEFVRIAQALAELLYHDFACDDCYEYYQWMMDNKKEIKKYTAKNNFTVNPKNNIIPRRKMMSCNKKIYVKNKRRIGE